MNNRVGSIKFTMEVTCLPDCDRTDQHNCSEVLNYLDVKMWLEQGKIVTDLYRKSNSKIQYLLPESAHPRHCFPGIAKSLAHRIVRICTRVEDREKQLSELKQMLLARSYRPDMLNKVMQAAMELDRSQTLEKVQREEHEPRVPYVVTFDPRLPAIPAILQKNWRVMVERDKRLQPVFKHPPMCSTRRGPNLANHLLRV